MPIKEFQDHLVNLIKLKFDKPFVSIFHTTRCRSTLILQDLFYSNYFATINEPPGILAEGTKKPEKKYFEYLLNLFSTTQKIPCLKANFAYLFEFNWHLENFKNSKNYFIYRNPQEVFLSNMMKKSDFFEEISKDNFLTEVLSQAYFIKKIFQDYTPHVRAKTITPISFEEVNNRQGLNKILKDFNLVLEDEKLQLILEKRKFDTHDDTKEYQGPVSDRMKKFKDDLKTEFAILEKKFSINQIYADFLQAI